MLHINKLYKHGKQLFGIKDLIYQKKKRFDYNKNNIIHEKKKSFYYHKKVIIFGKKKIFFFKQKKKKGCN